MGEMRLGVCRVMWGRLFKCTCGELSVFKCGGDPIYRPRRKIYKFTYWRNRPMIATLGPVVGSMKLRPISGAN